MPFCTDMATTVCLHCADLKHRELMLHSQLNLFQFAHPQNRALNQARHLHANSISEIYVTNVLVMVLVTEGDRRHRQPTFKHKLRFSKHKVLAYMVYLFCVGVNISSKQKLACVSSNKNENMLRMYH